MSHARPHTRSLFEILGDPRLQDRHSIVQRLRRSDPMLWRHACAVATSVAVLVEHRPELSPEERMDIVDAAWLHDIGKMAIASELLHKPAPLSMREWAVMKTHPARAADYLAPNQALRSASLLVRQHHEWFNGSGYPSGLHNQQIALGARIIAVADAYDAMTSWRSYRPVLTADRAFAELSRCTGTQFDPDIVALFVRTVGAGKMRTWA